MVAVVAVVAVVASVAVASVAVASAVAVASVTRGLALLVVSVAPCHPLLVEGDMGSEQWADRRFSVLALCALAIAAAAAAIHLVTMCVERLTHALPASSGNYELEAGVSDPRAQTSGVPLQECVFRRAAAPRGARPQQRAVWHCNSHSLSRHAL